jgi:hypothetical protein
MQTLIIYNTDELRATLDRIVADKDPSFILDAVQACSTEWPRLNAIDILGIIKSLIDIEESINLVCVFRAPCAELTTSRYIERQSGGIHSLFEPYLSS